MADLPAKGDQLEEGQKGGGYVEELAARLWFLLSNS